MIKTLEQTLKDDPKFDIEKYRVEEVAIVNFEKLKDFLQEVE
ncbi:TPA: hypothetical protein ACGPBH_001117 [Streptococcus suis]